MFDALAQMGLVAKLSVFLATVPAFFGAAYAFRPTETRLAVVRPVSLAAMFGALGGMLAGIMNVLHGAHHTNAPINSGDALLGVSESLVPLFVACGSLTLCWLFVAVGIRRKA